MSKPKKNHEKARQIKGLGISGLKKHYKSFSNKKVPFANEIKEHLSSNNSANILDLKKQIETLYNEIKKWNH